MPNTYTQLHIHLVFAVKHRNAVIKPEFREEIERVLKTETTHFINSKKFFKSRFAWQLGYGAFSHSHSALDKIIQYVLNQPEHHKKVTFREEYLEILKRFDVEYKAEYLFDFFE